jgi:NAD(P)-dependent dehydrogenase (short-subunit alcohol dehydrogenase family)
MSPSPQSDNHDPWTTGDMPDLQGRTAVVTGANAGLGFEIARVLAGHGAAVVLACRDTDKAEQSADRIRAVTPAADVTVIRLDLASLASVREAAASIRSARPRINLLINNAGVMMPPYSRTEDGFETQFGVNHLGHFALTGLLLDSLLTAPAARIVTVSSNGHRMGSIRFDDLAFERGYQRIRAYGQSKLANLMFSYELQGRLTAAGSHVMALAAHPGSASTELERYLPLWMRLVSVLVSHQSAAEGALPVLRAATDPSARGGEYYGPAGRRELTGSPVRVQSSARSRDADAQRRLWEVSENLTGVTYSIDPAPRRS